VAVKGYDLASLDRELTDFAHIITFPTHHGLPQQVSQAMSFVCNFHML